MAKSSEALEEILDELDVIKKQNEELKSEIGAIKKENADIKQSQAEISEKLSSAPTSQTQPSKEDDHALWDYIKNAIYQGIGDYFSAFPIKQNVLTQKDYNIIYTAYYNASNTANKQFYEERDKREQELHEKRSVMGIDTVEQVAKWAPEYPRDVQRLMRYLGITTLSEDEPIESAHNMLKLWGNVFVGITNQDPTFMSWVRFRWGKFKAVTNKWGVFQWYLVFIGIVAIVWFSSIYQSHVMDLDRTNRVFYHNVIKNHKRSKDYRELDSLIHDNSFFKTYRTLDN